MKKDILKDTYDFVFSLGEACPCSETIRSLNLQNASYPFDWLYGGNIETRTNLLISGFKDFINKEDLELVGQRKNPLPCDIYLNKKNNIVFNHDFAIDGNLDETYPQVKEKYDRRIKRLYERIDHANKILIMYIENPATKSKTKKVKPLIMQCYEKIVQKFPNKEFRLAYLNNRKHWFGGKKYLSDNILYYETWFRNKDKKTDAYVVDPEYLHQIFSKVKVNLEENNAKS